MTVILLALYIYISRKGRCQVPIFPRFWKCSVFATSCSILYVHIPVMVLLEIHTDCQTSSEVAKECPESHEDSQGKGRRKNKHSVCVYIYGFPQGERWPRKKRKKTHLFFFRAYPLSQPSYVHSLSLMAGCQRLPKNVQRVMKIPWEKEGKQTQCVYTLGERWPRKGSFFYELPPSPSPSIYSPPIYIDGLAFSLQQYYCMHL